MSSTTDPTIPALTGVRFLAASAVVIYHFRDGLERVIPGFAHFAPLTSAGDLGVDLFFVLSGFILVYNYQLAFGPLTRRAYLRFLWLRFARIYPVHVFTIALIALGLGFAAWRGVTINHPEAYRVSDLVRNLLLIHAWGAPYELTWNAPAWSISAEWFAYLWLPVVVIAARRVTRATIALAIASAAISAQLWIMIGVGFDASALVRIAGAFVMGAFLCRCFTLRPAAGTRWDAVAVISLAAVAATLVLVQPHGAARLVVVPFFGALIYALARARGILARALGSTPMVFLGEASYALYMTHGLIAEAGARLAPLGSFADATTAIRSAAVIGYVVALLGVAILTYLAVEQPTRRGLRAMIR